jgi:hypothetical protein
MKIRLNTTFAAILILIYGAWAVANLDSGSGFQTRCTERMDGSMNCSRDASTESGGGDPLGGARGGHVVDRGFVRCKAQCRHGKIFECFRNFQTSPNKLKRCCANECRQ